MRAPWSGLAALAACLMLALGACGGDDGGPTASPIRPPTGTPSAEGFTISSNSFGMDQPIPVRYTCEGADISPSLSWENPPSGTQSFTLVVDDPDAPSGSFTHWLLYDLPASAVFLPENIEDGERPAAGGVQGTNDGSRIGYTGPCPPQGSLHRYVFVLYALDILLELEPGASRADLVAAMEEHVLDEATLTGTFER